MMTALKKIGKVVVPEELWDEWRRRYRAPKTFWTWNGACRAAEKYDNDKLNRFRIARRKDAVDPIPLDHSLAIALSETAADASFSITDFGGSTGETMRAVLRRWPNARCTVVETAGLVSLIDDDSRGVAFSTEMPKDCDIFYTSGTIQYLADPYRLLASAFASAKMAVVLDRNSFSNRTIMRVQSARLYDNGHGPIPPGFEDYTVTYPHRTIKEGQVSAMARKEGFQLVHSAPEESGVLQYLGRVYGKKLIFRRDR